MSCEFPAQNTLTKFANMAMPNDYSRSSNETLEFSDAEIRTELFRLGYNDINEDQFEEFKRGK